MFGLPQPFIAERLAEERGRELIRAAQKRPEGSSHPGLRGWHLQAAQTLTSPFVSLYRWLAVAFFLKSPCGK
jgi:hypothetical protein